ncbi:MAG: hypothetical protein CM15mP127_02330 [Gammaproteobacteria bacterium]|nr:MAG: hypothetical protein CM15mP127_02330 [Gammaproteobacteria bacterium]
MNDDWEMRYYDLTRERIGFTYDANLLTSDTTSIFLSAFIMNTLMMNFVIKMNMENLDLQVLQLNHQCLPIE